jgi:hypothetical protein
MTPLTFWIDAIPIPFVRDRYRSLVNAATPDRGEPEPQRHATDSDSDQRLEMLLASAAMFRLLGR